MTITGIEMTYIDVTIYTDPDGDDMTRLEDAREIALELIPELAGYDLDARLGDDDDHRGAVILSVPAWAIEHFSHPRKDLPSWDGLI